MDGITQVELLGQFREIVGVVVDVVAVGGGDGAHTTGPFAVWCQGISALFSAQACVVIEKLAANGSSRQLCPRTRGIPASRRSIPASGIIRLTCGFIRSDRTRSTTESQNRATRSTAPTRSSYGERPT
ncbi:hypothetical protein [Mycolicibacterium sp.]|uniref:hypothetical protein n=1 Tax=Mycolicibacterium sp. TaxID=2320850 RepID=UPI003D09C1C0